MDVGEGVGVGHRDTVESLLLYPLVGEVNILKTDSASGYLPADSAMHNAILFSFTILKSSANKIRLTSSK